MKKIYLLLLFLLSLFHHASSQTNVIDAATGANIKSSGTVPQHKNVVHPSAASVNIDCGAGGKFWTVSEPTGSILEWQIAGTTITFLDTLFATSPVNSLAYCNLFNPGTIATTLYGSNYETVYYYNGTAWDSVGPTKYYPNVGGCGRFLYYMDLLNDLDRYEGTTFKTIFTLTGAGFSLYDVAVDAGGVSWPLISKGITTDSLIAVDSAGNVIRHFSLAHAIDPTNAYGSFIMDSTLYIGFGNSNSMYPNKILPIIITGDTAIIGNPIQFVNGNFADMASCSNALAAPPVADFTSSETTICADNCINFTNSSTNATSWQWIFEGSTDSTSTVQNPQNICYFIAGNYNVTLIASNSSGSDTVSINNFITVNYSPPTPVITQQGDTLFCSFDSSYASYQWYIDSSAITGATNNFLVLDSCITNYNVLVTGKDGCTIAVGISIDPLRLLSGPCANGIKNYSSGNLISLFPNPTGNKFTVYGLQFKVSHVEIYNVLGQEASPPAPLQRKGESAVIDVSGLPAGIYFVQFIGEKEKWVGKFVKE